MTWSNMRNAAVCGAIIGLLLFLFQKTTAVDMEEHYTFIHTLRSLQKVDVSLNENILKSRQAYLTNFDPIVENIRELKRIGADLEAIPSFVRPQDRAPLERLRGEWGRLVEQKEGLAERFKGEHAILRNALSFFPVAAAELADRVDGADAELAGSLRALLQEMLIYNLHSIEEMIPGIRQRIASLEAVEKTSAEVSEREDLARVIRHAETVLTYKGQLDRVTRDLLSLPTPQTLQGIYSDYQARYVKASAVANNYRLALYLASILLFSVIAYTLIRLKNAMTALYDANATLEQRVIDRTAELQKANIELSDQKDKLNRYIEEIRAAKEELQRIVVTDELTGLYTRRFLFEWMEKQVAAIGRRKGGFSCLIFDIDFFKKVNDTYGHGEGDRVLKQVAEVVRESVRQSDIVGRYGGEEFLVLLPATGLEDSRLVAEKVRLAIEANIKSPTQVTTSIGVGTCLCDRLTRTSYNAAEVIAALLEQADQALYRAKEGGRNRVEMGRKVIHLNPDRAADREPPVLLVQ